MFDLESFRVDKNLSQRALADQLGIAQSFVSKIENGKEPMPEAHISQLANLYPSDDIDKYRKTNVIDIKNLRNKVGLSQEKFAEMLGVHSRTVQNWERGGVIPEAKYAILRRIETEDINSPEMLKSALQSPSIDGLMELLREKDRQIAEKDAQIKRLFDLLEKK